MDIEKIWSTLTPEQQQRIIEQGVRAQAVETFKEIIRPLAKEIITKNVAEHARYLIDSGWSEGGYNNTRRVDLKSLLADIMRDEIRSAVRKALTGVEVKISVGAVETTAKLEPAERDW